MNAPKVLPVKDPPKEKHKPLHPNLPQPPALLLMVSPIRTGKSTIISNLLLNSNFYGQEYFDDTIVISPTIYNDKTSRFLKKSCSCYDEYSDELLDEILDEQKSYDDLSMRPDIALILDDVIGVFKGANGREPKINSLASRFRHFGIKLLLMSSQNYRKVSPVIRSNCTHMIIGSPFPNNRELGKIAEEVGDQFGGADNFLKIYHQATPNKYDFLYLNFTENPPQAWHKFEKMIAVGGQKNDTDAPETNLSNVNKVDENKIDTDNKNGRKSGK
tara:strand:- start:2259 stop:3077 length:819 start_codon:yes stop_codon:yes gene_type:complete